MQSSSGPRKRSPYLLEPLNIGEIGHAASLSTREPAVLRKHTILLERLLRKHSTTPGKQLLSPGDRAIRSPDSLACKVKNIVFSEHTDHSPSRKQWPTQPRKRKGMSVGGRSSLKRLEMLTHKGHSDSRPKHRPAASDESKLAVINLTYDSALRPPDDFSKTAIRHPPRSYVNTKKPSQIERVGELTITPVRKGELGEIAEVVGLSQQRSSSLTPSHWNLTHVSGAVKQMRRTVFTRQTGDTGEEG